MAVEGRDSHLAPLRVAYFEHGAWLPRHVCIERAKQQEVKSESIRADFNRFVSRRILPIYAAWSIPRPLLVKVAREGDYRIGYEPKCGQVQGGKAHAAWLFRSVRPTARPGASSPWVELRPIESMGASSRPWLTRWLPGAPDQRSEQREQPREPMHRGGEALPE